MKKITLVVQNADELKPGEKWAVLELKDSFENAGYQVVESDHIPFENEGDCVGRWEIL